ncbi:MAG: FtsX-like permease family protein [Candidatus Izemoplasmataceae bacterium]
MACLIFFFLAYYIERQKESIKILKILGYTNTSVSVSLLPFSLLLITVSLISYGMGLVLSSLFYPVYKARYQFPSASFEIDLQTLITGLIVPIVSIVLLSALFSFYLIKRVEKPIRYTPLKIRLNHSKNALFKGLLFLVISVLLLFSLYTSQMIDTFKETTTQGNDYAYNIVLAQFDDDALSHQEPYTLTSGSITFINETFLYNPLHLQVYGLSQDSTLKTLYTQSRPINYGVFDNGVIISKHASITHDLNAYDEITLSVGGVARTFRVIAISDELIESALYLDQAILNDMLGYESDSYNAYFTNQAPIQSDRTILRIIDYDRVVSEITTLFDFSNRLIETFLIFAVIIALVMFYFLMHKEFNDALKEHAMLKALGVDGFKLYMMGMFKSYFYITISFIAAYIMTGYLLKFLTAYLYDSLGFLFIFKQAYYIALISYIIVLILAFISTLSIFYRFNKTPLSIHLKA